MPKKPLAIDASTVLATKKGTSPPAGSGSLQRSQQASETFVDLNFKVPAEFRQHFKRLAVDADIKNVQLLRRAVKAYEREQEQAPIR